MLILLQRSGSFAVIPSGTGRFLVGRHFLTVSISLLVLGLFKLFISS